jgi:hypothetical protein
MFYLYTATESAWGEDADLLATFATLAEATAYIAETFGEDTSDLWVEDVTTIEVVWEG